MIRPPLDRSLAANISVIRAVGCWATDRGDDAAADGDGGGRGAGRRDVRGHGHRAVQRAGDALGREAGVRRGRRAGAPNRRGGPRRRVRRHRRAAPAGRSLLRAHGMCGNDNLYI